MKISDRLASLIDLLLLEILAVVIVSYCFRGATSGCDGFIHLSKIKMLLDSLKSRGAFPRWNPYWYFGIPMWRIYSPLSYYLMASLGWIFNLSLLDVINLWGYIVFSAATLSTYLLAKEVQLDRFGCLASGILFLTSANLIVYWGIGSYPNVTGVAFSPIVLLLFLRATEKRDLLSVLFSGLAFSLVLLIYLMNAVILFVLMVFISFVLILRKPSLSYTRKERRVSPEYALTLLKILFSTMLIAVLPSLWWVLPFLTTYLNAPSIPDVTMPIGSLVNHLSTMFGSQPNIYSPGIGHITLAIIGCIFIFLRPRGSRSPIAPVCFLVAFVSSFTPWLHIPTGPFYWWRVSSYLSLFAALCGGTAVEHLKGFYEEFFSRNLSAGLSRRIVVNVLPLGLSMLVLSASIYPVLVSADIVFPGYDVSKVPEDILLLESRWNPCERVAVDRRYDLDLYAKIPQSGGGNVDYMYMVNEFAYTFWYYIFKEKNFTYLPYFARNYNVRWLIGVDVPKETTNAVLYEVEGFNSELTEVVGPESILVLFVGEYSEYSVFFTSVALANPSDIVLVYGGETLEGYDLNTLRSFDVVYLGLRDRDLEKLDSMSSLLLDYVEEGGGVILDTGILAYSNELGDIPDPFPVEKIAIYGPSNLALHRGAPSDLTSNVDLARVSGMNHYSASYAKTSKAGATSLIYDLDRAIMVYWDRGSGRALWTGLGLPYLVMTRQGKEEAKLLINTIRFASSSKTEVSVGAVNFDCPSPEEILVHVNNASVRDAVWVKMSYYPGWKASFEDKSAFQLRIFQAGPNMMMVLPNRSGDYTIRFYFGKTWDVQIGEAVSQVGVALFLFLAFILFLKRGGKASNPS